MGKKSSWSNAHDEYEDKDVKGAHSDGKHTTVWKDDNTRRSWDTDDRGQVTKDHTTDQNTHEITEHNNKQK